MAQLFPAWSNPLARIGLILLLLAVPLVVAGAMLAVRSDYATGVGIAVEQPVPFSHEHHAGRLRIDCRYCHTGVETSPFAGVPATHVCMTCHSQVWTEAEALEAVRASYENNEPLRWSRVNDLADYAYFDHSVHVRKGVACESCHGRIDRMPAVRATNPFFMGFCLDCHRNPGPHLRPQHAITAMGWRPDSSDPAQGETLLQHYGIKTAQLDDCSICHR